MNYTADIKFIKYLLHRISIIDIGFYEKVVFFFLYIPEVFEVTGIGKFIKVDDSVFRVFVHHESHEVRTNKSGTSGYEQCFHMFIFYFYR